MLDKLPAEVLAHVPRGREGSQGVWLVMPTDGDNGILEMNSWLRSQDWFPLELEEVIWFGDDGVGNFIGWDPASQEALLWNPEDGGAPWKKGSVSDMWRFILSDYTDET